MDDGRRGGWPLTGTPTPPRPATDRGPGESLLTELLTNHLDPGYAAAARRRPPAVSTPWRRRAGSVITAALVFAAGVLLATAYQQTRSRAPQAARTRAELVADVQRRAALTDRLQRQDDQTRRALRAQQDQALRTSTVGSAASSQLKGLEVDTGLVALRGPGLAVTLSDGTGNVDPVTGRRIAAGTGGDPSKVQDRDLQDVVNSLWAAGAEAIAVNGQRLSPLSTIRSAGAAVLVDLRPVTSPYTVRAIGNPDAMEPAFAASATSRLFGTYAQLYGIGLQVRRAKTLTVPAASAPALRFAAPAPSPAGTASPGGGN